MNRTKDLHFRLLIFVVVFFSGHLFSPEGQARDDRISCPVGLDPICDSNPVRSLLNLQSAIDRAMDAGSQDDIPALTRSQTLVFLDMDEIAHIEIVSRYLSGIDVARGLPGSARAIALAAVERARDILLDRPRTVSPGDVFDIFKLLDLSRHQGGQSAARHSLDKIVTAMEKPDGGYIGGFAIVEADHTLAQWGETEKARDHFRRARRMARSQPLRDQRGFDVRFMIMIHAAQKAWESRFSTMARDILDETEALRVGAYENRDDLGDPIRILREHFGG